MTTKDLDHAISRKAPMAPPNDDESLHADPTLQGRATYPLTLWAPLGMNTHSTRKYCILHSKATRVYQDTPRNAMLNASLA